MNITPSYPNFIPLALQPSTESARRDNTLRERIPAATQGEPYARESQIGSEKDKARSNESRQGAQAGESSSRQGMPGDVAVAERQGRGQQQEGKEGNKEKGSDSQSRQQQAEQKEIESLKARDQEVRIHEQAHQGAGGQYASSPSYTMSKGPDGKSYATGGSVQIDISPIAGDPAATVQKMQQVRSAALAPAEPSGQDRSVAAKASQLEAKARKELASANAVSSRPSGEQSRQAASADDASQSSATGSASLQWAGGERDPVMQRRAAVISQRYDTAWRPADGASVSRYA
ncbi:MAG: putative metalloprotease CJM1_0395 family protein [Aeromonadaceae bacterium]